MVIFFFAWHEKFTSCLSFILKRFSTIQVVVSDFILFYEEELTMQKKKVFIFCVLSFLLGAFFLTSVVKNNANKKWLSLIEELYFVDRVEVIGYTNDKIILSDKYEVDQFMDFFLPVLNVNSLKKQFNKYLDEQLLEIYLFTNQSEIVSVQVYKLLPEIELEKEMDFLQSFTFKIDGAYCIAIINERYCRISPYDKDLTDFLSSYK